MSGHVLVTGGAGYIGAHACKVLKRAGFIPVTFDNLATGWADAVRFGPFVQGDLLDRAAIDAAFAQFSPVAVMHFAALSLVGESVMDPGKYWRGNVLGALNLIEAAIDAKCLNFVFSSTCATYGDHDGVLLSEDTPQRPLNPYGASKRAIEDMLGAFANSHGLRHVIFRYFNVAGSDPEGEVGEQHRPETHLIPLILDAVAGKRAALTVFGSDYPTPDGTLGEQHRPETHLIPLLLDAMSGRLPYLQIFGDDYPTPDGTCIRDYVHVMDLVDAHVRGLEWLLEGRENRVFNLGSGHGFSVRQVIEAAERVTRSAVPVIEGPRRAGDAAFLVSGSHLASAELGWQPRGSSLDQMIADAMVFAKGPGYLR